LFWTWRMPKATLGVALATLIAVTAVYAGRPLELIPPSGTILPMGPVAFHATREIAAVRLDILPAVAVTHHTSGKTITLKPNDPLRPGATYTVEIEAVDTTGERIRRSFALRVAPLADSLWVYVKLDAPRHRVEVYRGDTLVRTMIASGGRPGFETPEGVFRIQNRGYHFFSQKYQEGAYYWVRIFGNYLFHSVPVDIEGNIIEEEARRLGCPASHGCVRLSFPDAKWFYDNVPDGTLVVIDRT